MKRQRGSHGISQINFLSETVKALMEFTIPEIDASVLDMGCGKCFYGLLLRGYFDKRIYLEGVDINIEEPYITIANAIYDKVTNHTSILDYEFTKKFDMVFINHVLEHLKLDDAVQFLRKLMDEDLTDSILIGLPIPNNPDHVYKQDGSPDDHKWGLHNFPFNEFDFHKVKTKNKRPFLMVWSRNKAFMEKQAKNLIKLVDASQVMGTIKKKAVVAKL